MRPSRWPLLCVAAAAAVAVAGCRAAESNVAPSFTLADSTAVRTSVANWASTIVARDFDGWAATITPDVILNPPNSRPIVGRAAAVDYVRNYPVITKFDVVVEEQWGRENAAYNRGTFMLALKLPDGTVATDTGSFVSIFRRQSDGTWAHDRVMWNSNLPSHPPAPAQAGGRD